MPTQLTKSNTLGEMRTAQNDYGHKVEYAKQRVEREMYNSPTTLRNIAYHNVSVDLSADIPNKALDSYITPDSSKLFILDGDLTVGKLRIIEFDLTILQDITTATFSQDFSSTFSNADPLLVPANFKFSPSGNVLIVLDSVNNVFVQYLLSEPFVLSTAVRDSSRELSPLYDIRGFDLVFYANKWTLYFAGKRTDGLVNVNGDGIYVATLQVSGDFDKDPDIKLGGGINGSNAGIHQLQVNDEVAYRIKSLNLSSDGKALFIDNQQDGYHTEWVLSGAGSISSHNFYDVVYLTKSFPDVDLGGLQILSTRYYDNGRKSIRVRENGELFLYDFSLIHQNTKSIYYDGDVTQYENDTTIILDLQGPETQTFEIKDAGNFGTLNCKFEGFTHGRTVNFKAWNTSGHNVILNLEKNTDSNGVVGEAKTSIFTIDTTPPVGDVTGAEMVFDRNMTQGLGVALGDRWSIQLGGQGVTMDTANGILHLQDESDVVCRATSIFNTGKTYRVTYILDNILNVAPSFVLGGSTVLMKDGANIVDVTYTGPFNDIIHIISNRFINIGETSDIKYFSIVELISDNVKETTILNAGFIDIEVKMLLINSVEHYIITYKKQL